MMQGTAVPNLVSDTEKKRAGNRGKGRPKGAKNKITTLKQAIQEALDLDKWAADL